MPASKPKPLKPAPWEENSDSDLPEVELVEEEEVEFTDIEENG